MKQYTHPGLLKKQFVNDPVTEKLITTTQNILKTLGYFDLFHYPLNKEEIYLFHQADIAAAAIDHALETLLRDQFIFNFDTFYSLHNDPALVKRRCTGNLLAVEQMKIAGKVAKLLAKFPYTKAIAVSGSLSKNYADENSDIDFFIVTEANRLWIARTLMHLYKKLTFLTGRQHWFCMNYYVDEAALEIPEKNIFTAMEIITLVPMQGKAGIARFFDNNKWTQQYFPVHPVTVAAIPEIKAGMIRKCIEKLLGGRLGNYIDQQLMYITQKRWQKKTDSGKLNNRGCVMAMSVGRHFSKPKPENFQAKIIRQYEYKVNQLQHVNKTPVVLA